MMHSIYLYIAIMAGVSFLIRTLPLTLIRRPITNRFLRSFLFYVPYVTLAVMTFPAIVQATQSPLAGALAHRLDALHADLHVAKPPVGIAFSAYSRISAMPLICKGYHILARNATVVRIHALAAPCHAGISSPASKD